MNIIIEFIIVLCCIGISFVLLGIVVTENDQVITIPLPTSTPEVYYYSPSNHIVQTLQGATFQPSELSYTLSDSLFITLLGEEITLTTKEQTKLISVKDLFHIDRPSLSPTGKYIVVQASEEEHEGMQGPEDINIYTISLETGEWQRISKLPWNEENPVWHGDMIYYNSFSAEEGIFIHGYSTTTHQEHISFEHPSFHLSISPDGRYIFDSVNALLLDSTSGQILLTLQDNIHTTLQEEGYSLDTRYPGQAELGSCPLSSDFSPDGTQIVFDCAVEKEGKYGAIIAIISLETSEIDIVSDLIAYNPYDVNDNNFSPLHVQWI